MPLPGNIEAVTFDVGGTLIQPWPSVGHVYAEVAARRGHSHVQPEGLNRQFADAWRRKKGFDHSRRAWAAVVQETFAGILDETAVGELFSDLYDRFRKPDAWRVFDDVQPTLERLRRHPLKLGVISNWDERLRPLLAQLRLDAYFESVVVSLEAGYAKPACEIFQQAVSRLGVPASSILHVGDSFGEDIVGAQSAGLKGLLLDRKGASPVGPSILSLNAVLDMLGIR